jgi:RimJ/RimL family protein N-acetyltransferase
MLGVDAGDHRRAKQALDAGVSRRSAPGCPRIPGASAARPDGRLVSTWQKASNWDRVRDAWWAVGPVGEDAAMILLRTARLVLRSWRDEDLEAFLDLYGRWEVMRWLGPHPRAALTDLDQARERLARWQHRQEGLTAPLGLWAMVPRSPVDAVPVGTVLLLPLVDAQGPTDEVEVGWHLHPQWQGQGLATEAATALLGAAADAGIPRVLAVTDPDNVTSQAVANRLGMVDTGSTERWFGLRARQYVWTSPGSGSG